MKVKRHYAGEGKKLNLQQTDKFIKEYGTETGSQKPWYGCRPIRRYTLFRDMPVFKAARDIFSGDPVIINMMIPAGSIVYVAEDGWKNCKCRANKAVVYSIVRLSDHQYLTKARSSYSRDFIYKPGKTATPESGFYDGFNICDRGIHFFVDVNSAVNYLA